MAEPTNGSFRLLLDVQKKSNEQLATISQTLIDDGSAKEIIKQSFVVSNNCINCVTLFAPPANISLGVPPSAA